MSGEVKATTDPGGADGSDVARGLNRDMAMPPRLEVDLCGLVTASHIGHSHTSLRLAVPNCFCARFYPCRLPGIDPAVFARMAS